MSKAIFGWFGGSGLNKEAQVAASKFDSDEMHLLKKTWEDLADRTNGKGIDKETFLQYFPLNGLLGERLFAQFDQKNNGLIDLDEFITGLAKVCRGSSDDKIHFVFDMYNASHDKTVSKQELSTLLNHVPKEALYIYGSDSNRASMQSPGPHHQFVNDNEDQYVDLDNGNGSETQNADDNTDFEEIDYYTNHDMVEKAFAECDLNHEGRLTYEEFKMWVQRTPMIMDYIESILPYNGPKDLQPHHDKKDTLPHLRRITSKAGSLSRGASVNDFAGDIFNHSTSVGTARERRNSVNNLAKNSSMRGSRSSISDNGSHSQQNGELQLPGSPRATFANRGTSVNGSVNGSSSYMSPTTGMSPVMPHLDRESTIGSVGSAMEGQDIRRSYSGDTGHGGNGSTCDPSDLCMQYLQLALDHAHDDTLRNSIQDVMSNNSLITFGRNDSEVYRTVVCLEDYLWKKGKSLFHMLSKRFYLLSGNCMYYYTHKHDVRPRGVIFLTGSIVERVKDDDMEMKGYFGFELLHQDLCTGEHHRHDKRVMYCKSLESREKWVTTLQHAAHVVPIEDDYVIGKELGRGRFSVVCECVHKITGEHCAVKIIDKATIEPEEKVLLRTEIAVLKLVDHPNIIRMEGLYESKSQIYIVMEMLKGGELFERIVGRPRFTEAEALKLIRPLLESVAYLHDLGIVHRDLKPENILCGEELEDLKIADFGLSKMVLPKEKMDSACGTLSYVAPEVLTMQGYGKEADLWSVGVIMFLLLCGKLPFDGEDHNEIIRCTIQADMKVNPTVWAKLTSEAQDLISSLLNKDPKERITARDSLRHPFFAKYNIARRQSLIASRGISMNRPPFSTVSSSNSVTVGVAHPAHTNLSTTFTASSNSSVQSGSSSDSESNVSSPSTVGS
jgi:serine/threonine protein kinase/Ca2+-binding EF-hand superfamily protein